MVWNRRFTNRTLGQAKSCPMHSWLFNPQGRWSWVCKLTASMMKSWALLGCRSSGLGWSQMTQSWFTFRWRLASVWLIYYKSLCILVDLYYLVAHTIHPEQGWWYYLTICIVAEVGNNIIGLRYLPWCPCISMVTKSSMAMVNLQWCGMPCLCCAGNRQH